MEKTAQRSGELCDLDLSPNFIQAIKSRRMRCPTHVARMRRAEVHTGFLVARPDGKGPLGRPSRRWEDNIKVDLQEVGCRGYGLDRAGSG